MAVDGLSSAEICTSRTGIEGDGTDMRAGGLSANRLKRLHDVMTGYVERGEVPGLVTMVARRGEGHVDAIGAMADGSEEPMRRDSIFRISSMTKPITAVAAMI